MCREDLCTIHIPVFNYYDVISIKAESPEMNAKIERRPKGRHRIFIAGWDDKLFDNFFPESRIVSLF